MARVTESYVVFSLVDALEECRFIDDDTSIRIEYLGVGGIYIISLKQMNLHRVLKHHLPYADEPVFNFTFYQNANVLYIKTY